MTLTWRKSESTERPLEVDTTSSRTTVFLRQNITETERDTEDGDTVTMYEYEEAKLTHGEYAIYLAEKNAEVAEMQSEAIDYLLMGGE